ncbi:hypothetical protein K501DRAFT_277096 [Backusella circina FSU 941]|nr:hypothetical protein K501DRAFT_277096 [Backusella circina FSU 941]
MSSPNLMYSTSPDSITCKNTSTRRNIPIIKNNSIGTVHSAETRPVVHEERSPFRRLPSTKYAPLTRDRLLKKDKLDVLLHDGFTPYAPRIKRRRTIACGNIYRHRYNEDNSPMVLADTLATNNSMNSAASNHSHSMTQNRYDKSVKTQMSTMNMPTLFPYFSSDNNNSSNKLSSGLPENRSYGTMCNNKSPTSIIYSHHHRHRHHHHRSSNHRRMNDANKSTTNNSKSVNSGFTSHPTEIEENHVGGPPRRFSGLVRLSAAHIANRRTRRNKNKQNDHATSTLRVWYRLLSKLKNIASRVIDTRASEPTDTRMSVDELVSLSCYLDALKTGVYNTDEHDIPPSNRPLTTPLDDFPSTEEPEEMPLPHPETLPPPPPNHLQRLTSLGNIFPLARFERTPSVSRSVSDVGSFHETPQFEEPHRTLLSRVLDRIYDAVSSFLHFFSMKSFPYQPIHLQHTQIQFQGWSLWLFSPTSLVRLSLWKIIGSSPSWRVGRFLISVSIYICRGVRFCPRFFSVFWGHVRTRIVLSWTRYSTTGCMGDTIDLLRRRRTGSYGLSSLCRSSL